MALVLRGWLIQRIARANCSYYLAPIPWTRKPCSVLRLNLSRRRGVSNERRGLLSISPEKIFFVLAALYDPHLRWIQTQQPYTNVAAARALPNIRHTWRLTLHRMTVILCRGKERTAHQIFFDARFASLIWCSVRVARGRVGSIRPACSHVGSVRRTIRRGIARSSV